MPQLLERLTPHLDRLQGMARQYDDWIVDNAIQSLEYTSLFLISDAIETLSDNYFCRHFQLGGDVANSMFRSQRSSDG